MATKKVGPKNPRADEILAKEPQQKTAELLDISVTERGQFRSCHRRWWLQTIQGLEPDKPTWPLLFGTGIHAALEQYYLGPRTGRKNLTAREEAAIEAFLGWYAETEDELEASGASPGELDELYSYSELGQDMLESYFLYDQTTDASVGKVLAVEGHFQRNVPGAPRCGNADYPPEAQPVIDEEAGRILIPIVDPLTKEPIADNIPCLTMKMDLLVERATPRKGLWVVDHKTSSSAYNDRGLDFNDQATGYCYGVWRLTGVVPRGAMFNVLIKNTPQEPRRLKNGNLSTAKDQLTTADMYREELKADGLMTGGKIHSEKHAECLNALLARGWAPFFQRLEPTRNEHELVSFERRLGQEYLDMKRVLSADDVNAAAYPNQNDRVCPYCPVAPICQAMEDGSDWQHVQDTMFRKSADRKA